MLKSYRRTILKEILKNLTRCAIKKHKIKIILITGEGKTGVIREVTYEIVKNKYAVRRNVETSDSEFVIPLTVLGADYYPQNTLSWVFFIIKTCLKLTVLNTSSHFVILEANYIEKGIFEYWKKILKPQATVFVTKNKGGREKGVIYVDDTNLFKPVSYAKYAKEIGKRLKIKPKEALFSLNKVDYPKPKIRLYEREGLITVDSSYIYRPPPIKGIIETLNDINKEPFYVVSDYSKDKKTISRLDKLTTINKRGAKKIKSGVLIIRLNKIKCGKFLEELIYS